MRSFPPQNIFASLWRVFVSRQFALFLLFGGTAAITSLTVGVGLYDFRLIPGLPYWLCVTLASCVGLVVNFGLNYAFNFKYRARKALAQFLTFALVSAGGMILTTLIAHAALWSLVQMNVTSLPLPFHHQASARFMGHFFAVGVVTLYSYVGHKYFSFSVGFRQRLKMLLKESGNGSV